MNTYILFYKIIIFAMLIMSPITFISLLFISAPYGRYARCGFGPSISSHFGFMIMEIPAVFVILFCFLLNPQQSTAYVLLFLWEAHYIHRTFIYPLQLPNPNKPMPLMIIIMGAIFNCLNGYINGISLILIHHYTFKWLVDPRFMIGVIIFLIGFVINRQSDWILLHLRKPGETSYKIPQGGLYTWISCPNYLGEIIQWLGWFFATWSLAGFVFFIWTAANLVPRALQHHRWYHEKFPDYPRNRRALIPKLL